MRPVPWNLIARLVREGLMEDIGPGDVTSEAVVPAGRRARGVIRAQAPLVVAGIEPAILCFRALDDGILFPHQARHGDRLDEGATVLAVEGSARAILMAERTALNFLGRLSGIATLAARCVDAVSGLPCAVYGTRKTTPGWRWLEKDALAAGGARPHRSGLYDAVLIKDNHLIVAGGIGRAVSSARETAGAGIEIEVEVDTLDQLDEALRAGADVVLLDNMTPDQLRVAVKRTAGRARLEASGGITPASLREAASTGVDRISLGALTHSAPAAPLSLSLEEAPP